MSLANSRKPQHKKPNNNHTRKNERSLKNACSTKATKTKAPCEVFGKCGGCSLLDKSYDDQLSTKQREIEELFASVSSAKIQPILGMDEPYYYRDKVIAPYAYVKTSKKGDTRRGRGDVSKRDILCGMYTRGTHKIIQTDHCLLENKIAKKVTLEVRSLMKKWSIEPYDEDRHTGFMRHCVVRVGHVSGEVLVALVTNSDTFPKSRSFCRELVRRVPQITTIVQSINTRETNVVLGNKERVLYGPGFILDKLCGLSFRLSAGSFYQVNSTQTEVLYNAALELASLDGTQSVLDAYCGTGTIGLVAASRGAKSVVGVDAVSSAISDAHQNARHNGIENAEFFAMDATEYMQRIAGRNKGGEGDAAARINEDFVVIMDPPRAGSTEEFLRAAAALKPARIVYVSCNPQTQLRDVEVLEKLGYFTTLVQPVDMFPHTPHIETIALIEPAR